MIDKRQPLPMPESIADTWQEFRNKVIPPDASKTQLDQMELAYYSGVLVSMNLIHTIAHDEALPEEVAAQKMENLHKECLTYHRDQVRKYVEGN